MSVARLSRRALSPMSPRSHSGYGHGFYFYAANIEYLCKAAWNRKVGAFFTVDGAFYSVNGAFCSIDGAFYSVDGAFYSKVGAKSPVCGAKSPVCGAKSPVCAVKSTVCAVKSTVCAAFYTIDGAKSPVQSLFPRKVTSQTFLFRDSTYYLINSTAARKKNFALSVRV